MKEGRTRGKRSKEEDGRRKEDEGKRMKKEESDKVQEGSSFHIVEDAFIMKGSNPLNEEELSCCTCK